LVGYCSFPSYEWSQPNQTQTPHIFQHKPRFSKYYFSPEFFSRGFQEENWLVIAASLHMSGVNQTKHKHLPFFNIIPYFQNIIFLPRIPGIKLVGYCCFPSYEWNQSNQTQIPHIFQYNPRFPKSYFSPQDSKKKIGWLLLLPFI